MGNLECRCQEEQCCRRQMRKQLVEEDSVEGMLSHLRFGRELQESVYPMPEAPACWTLETTYLQRPPLPEPAKEQSPRTLRQAGRVYRELRERERTFYEILALDGNCQASELLTAELGAEDPVLAEFCPSFYGLRPAQEVDPELAGEKSSQLYLELEDVCSKLQQPATCRLRLGTQSAWALEAEGRMNVQSPQTRFDRWRQDLLRTSGSLGWVVAEIESKAGAVRAGVGELYTDEAALESLAAFVLDAGAPAAPLVAKAFLHRVVAICRWFQSRNRHTRFFGSALLFAYDALGRHGTSCGALVSMVDFAHTAPLESSQLDTSGYIVGLVSLIVLLSQLAQMGRPMQVPGVTTPGGAPMCALPDRGALLEKLHRGQAYLGAVVFALVKRQFCILVVDRGTGGADWSFPCFELGDEDPVHVAAQKLLMSSIGLDMVLLRMQLPARIMVHIEQQGPSLRLINLVLAKARATTGMRDASIPTENLRKAVDWSVWKGTDSTDKPFVRAWVPLEKVPGVLTDHWSRCALQACWPQLLDAASNTATTPETTRALMKEEIDFDNMFSM